MDLFEPLAVDLYKPLRELRFRSIPFCPGSPEVLFRVMEVKHQRPNRLAHLREL